MGVCAYSVHPTACWLGTTLGFLTGTPIGIFLLIIVAASLYGVVRHYRGR